MTPPPPPPSYFKICLKEIDRTAAFKKLPSALLFNLQLEKTKEHFLRSCFLIIFHKKKKKKKLVISNYINN